MAPFGHVYLMSYLKTYFLLFLKLNVGVFSLTVFLFHFYRHIEPTIQTIKMRITVMRKTLENDTMLRKRK